jgi:hypothetical protein
MMVHITRPKAQRHMARTGPFFIDVKSRRNLEICKVKRRRRQQLDKEK